jgi:hypothetical protein
MEGVYRRLRKAESLVIARQLADLGARPRLVQVLTGVSHQVSRGLCQAAGGEAQVNARFCRDFLRWVEAESERLNEALRFWLCHEHIADAESPAEHLVRGYILYRRAAPSGDDGSLLGIEHCHEVVRRVGEGDLFLRECPTCGGGFLTATELSQCPACKLEAVLFCRACGARLPDPVSRLGRPRQYCDACQDPHRRQQLAQEARALGQLGRRRYVRHG